MNRDFKNTEISDKIWVQNILDSSSCPTLEYNFTTLFIWQKIYNTQIAEHNGFLLSASGKETKSFLFPVGSGNIKAETDYLFELAHSEGTSLKFHCLNAASKGFLEENYPRKFEFSDIRDSSDYVYTSESLRTLSGKKLSAKRNHINRFVENYPEWRYEKITEKNIEDALKMHDDWCVQMNCAHDSDLAEETCAVRRTFKYYAELGVSGGLLRTEDMVCAFSIGDKLNDKTFLVHIEKAYADVQGAYPMINKQFVIDNCNEFEFVNREDDAGDEGLRKAKLSYNPYEIISKFNAVEK